ncbi:MAG: hypothetical protein ACYTHN_18245 [Planctomycetota bacterium]|jgi:hypothetical protein
MMQFALSAVGGNIVVEALTLTGSGSGDDGSDVAGVSLYRDTNSNGILDTGTDILLGGSGAYGADNGTVTFSGLSRTIPSGGSELWLVVYDFHPSAICGRNFTVSIASSNDVAVSGGPPAPSVNGPPVTSAPMTTGDFGTLHVALGAGNPAASDVAAGAEGVEILHLSLTAGNGESIRVSRLAVKAIGTMGNPEANVSVSLYADANGNGVYDADDRFLYGPANFIAATQTALLWDLQETILATQTVTWFVLANLSDAAPVGETIGLCVEQSDDIQATGCTSGNAITATGTPVVGEMMTVISASGTSNGSQTHRAGCGGGAGGPSSAGGVFGCALLFLALFLLARRGRRKEA